jgi:hypothetical protein
MDVTGGQATSISLNKSKYGAGWMNDGVQGGSLVCLSNRQGPFLLDLSRFLNIPSISFRKMATNHRKSVYRLPLAKSLMAFGLIAFLATWSSLLGRYQEVWKGAQDNQMDYAYLGISGRISHQFSLSSWYENALLCL